MEKKGNYVTIKFFESGKMDIEVPKIKGMVPGWVQYSVAVAIMMKIRDKEFEKLVWKKWDKITKMLERKKGE